MNRTDISLIALRKILRATELYGRKLASAAGLTAVQFRVLQIVSESATMTPKDISKQMGVSQATITSLIDKLEKQGMVCRTKSEADRRQINITLTPRGVETVDTAPDALQQRYVRQFESLQEWEQAQLISSLERIAAMLDAAELDVAPVLDSGDFRNPH